ncbi:hypothetical protein RB653_009183 [Dictyostelium firmibasis]|uniref:EGF-like domain-containing protein n=1 Tax=Dictyostelium firmibasis TaxID=79012 RepID=A0AAN7Z0F0_9MYCE
MNRFSIVFLIIINLLIKFNNGQLTPLTTETSILASVIDSSFSRYPSSSDGTSCYFYIKILIEVPLGATIKNSSIGIYLISSNDNIYLYFFQSSQPIGKNSQEITFTTSDDFQQQYQLNTTCLDVDISKIEVVNFSKPMYFLGYIMFYITLVGLEPGLYFDLVSTNPPTTFIQNSNFLDSYNYLVTITQVSNNLTQGYPVEIIFNSGKSVSFTLDSYYSFFEEKDLPTNHFETFFPSNILSNDSNYTQISNGYQPLFTSTLNTNIMNPFQAFNYTQQPLSQITLTLPIKGTKGNLTFIGIINDIYNTGTLFNSSIVTENGTSTNSIELITKINVKPIPFMGINSILVQYTSIVPIYTVSFKNTNDFQFYPFSYSFLTSSSEGWPFGFISGKNSNFSHQVSFPRLVYQSNITVTSYIFNSQSESFSQTINPISKPNSSPPIIKSYKYTRITNIDYILSINIESLNGLKGFTFSAIDFNHFTQYTLINGTIYSGTIELIINLNSFSNIYIYDSIWNIATYGKGSLISLNPLITFDIPQPLNYQLNFSNFIDVSFLKNNLDLNFESESYNIVYLNSTELPHDTPLSFSLLDIISIPMQRDSEFTTILKNEFIYNTTSRLFESKFILPKNNIFGEIGFQICWGQNYIQGNSLMKELLIVNNTILDNQGPIFSLFEKIGNGSIISTTGTVGWKFNITDDLNGFESGYIKVMGSVDSSTYEFNFTINDVIGDKFNCQYQILINISEPCISQEYRIVKVILYDSNDIASKFYLYGNGIPNSNINPFMNFLDIGEDITIIPFTCSTSTMYDSKPTLLSFKSSTTTIDVGATNRTISFDFSIDPGVNGIKQDQLPIVYLTTQYTEISKCYSKLISYSTNSVHYNCSTELPIGFGYPGILILSMYGIVNNGGYYYGYSTNDIQSVLNSNFYLNTSFSSNLPIITSTSRYFSDDNGEIIIFGRGFSTISQVNIVYNDSRLSPNSLPLIAFYGSSAIKVSGIKSTEKSFNIKLLTTNGLSSNEYTIQPIYFNQSPKPTPTVSPTSTPTPTASPTSTPTPTASPTSTPTSTPIPTETPIPTNAPQKCQGNPECGGKNQGYCSSAGCICYAPWIGLTCTSQIIIVPQPTINTTNPQTEIPTTPTDNNQTSSEESQKMIFKSLVSLVSLRELNFINEEVNNHIFDQWIYTPINQFKNQYFTTVSSTNITVTLEWFNQTTSIEFANQNLTMNPSTIKYTIEISNYPFANKLNQLQLVMSASLTLNSNDICSSNQFGNTSTGDDSNYLKIQIENHSLYGRFIKRAIIDNIVKSVDNVLLDSSLNVIDSSSSSLQSFIGITIPYYFKSIIVDPDFSVLIDSKSASDNNDSVCTKNKSGLTTSQLAGIIVGSVGFAAVIIITTTYIVIKKRRDRILFNTIKNVNNIKMK